MGSCWVLPPPLQLFWDSCAIWLEGSELHTSWSWVVPTSPSWDAAAIGAWHSPEVQNEAWGALGCAWPPRNKVLPCFMLRPGTHPASSGAALPIFEARKSPATPFPIGFKPCCTKGRACAELLGSHAGPPWEAPDGGKSRRGSARVLWQLRGLSSLEGSYCKVI